MSAVRQAFQPVACVSPSVSVVTIHTTGFQPVACASSSIPVVNKQVVKEALARINQATDQDADSMFRDCCGSSSWANRMAKARPFASDTELIETAASIWNDLETRDWLEAFSAHPKIGETKAASTQQARSSEWSAGEQAGMNLAGESTRHKLSKMNDEYHDRFGFIFIVCATGKTADEMLEICRARMTNDRETEIAIAAREQQKITEIRLRKLLLQ